MNSTTAIVPAGGMSTRAALPKGSTKLRISSALVP